MTAGAEQCHQYDFAAGIPLAPLRSLRDWLRALLVAELEELLIDVELVATELVTNAYEHTDRPLAIRVVRPPGAGVLRVEVDDGDPTSLPRAGTSSRGGFRGRGLAMVEGISRAWGVEVHGRYKTVWADLPTR